MILLQKLLLLPLILVLSFDASAQKLPPLDASPADIAIFRPGGRGTVPVAKVTYGRPQKKDRKMIGGSEAYGKIWRTGANESTEIKFFKDVTLGGSKISAGTYTLYAIPGESEWTLIINSKLDTWGAFEYDEKKDITRVKVPVSASENDVEAFTIVFDGKDGAGNMILAWEKWMVKAPITY